MLDSPHLTAREPHFNAMRMRGGIGQYVLHDAVRERAASLVLFQHDIHLNARHYICAVLSFHNETVEEYNPKGFYAE
jgi:hypothetical protein